MPECRINLAHLVAYLCEAPKSTRAYEAYNRAEAAAKLDLTIPVPLPMRNAPTGLMEDLGYGMGYCYNPNFVYVGLFSLRDPIRRETCVRPYRHPVHNDYLPIQFRGDHFLRVAGDLTGKVWDEDALRRWENEVNGGKEWEGRQRSR
jgi:putative ATPase